MPKTLSIDKSVSNQITHVWLWNVQNKTKYKDVPNQFFMIDNKSNNMKLKLSAT